MSLSSAENTSSRITAAGLAFVTLFIFTQSVTDPVNATKLFVLGGFAFATFGAQSRNFSIELARPRILALLALALFSVASVSTLLASKAPFTQSVYGVYGRNNGYLLYLFLTIIFISTLFITSQSYFSRYLVALAVAGIANVAYAIWVLAFGDFIEWSNPYGNFLGTLGNPDFIGSFFGMFSAMLFSFLLAPGTTKVIRLSSLALLPLVFSGIVQSHAVQGKVLFISGLAISSFYWVRDRASKSVLSLSYLALLGVGFLVALFGTLQKGPLSASLYKETVSLRGEYWYAGWKTGVSNPIFGAGFDSLGDWYRRSRRDSALKLPGVDTVTNASHNVFLDIFSFGGWPLFLAYIAIVVIVLISIVKFTLRNRKFDPIFVALTSVWLCYQLQSTISINQIGLAVWGWAFGGAIIAYDVIDSKKNTNIAFVENRKSGRTVQRRQSTSSNIVSPGLVAGLAAIAGLIIAVPPLSADSKWRSAQIAQSPKLVELTLKPSYMNPLNSYKFINNVGVFETNGFTDLAHKYALEAVKFNPESYESWRNLYRLSKTTNNERELALANMKRLDPLNPNVGDNNK